eukprot:scaffold45596_cov58-Attheya_sp.AAC.1
MEALWSAQARVELCGIAAGMDRDGPVCSPSSWALHEWLGAELRVLGGPEGQSWRYGEDMGRTEANYPSKQFWSESRVGIGSFLRVEFADVVCIGAD